MFNEDVEVSVKVAVFLHPCQKSLIVLIEGGVYKEGIRIRVSYLPVVPLCFGKKVMCIHKTPFEKQR